MKLQDDAYPIVVTDRLGECRDFYTRRLGFNIGFEASWFVYLLSDAAVEFERLSGTGVPIA